MIFHIFTINRNHMMCGSWDMECDRHTLLSLWTVFCSFIPIWTQKIKILKSWKKMPRSIIILHKCTINGNHIMYGSWDMKYEEQSFWSFWTPLCPFILWQSKNSKLNKNKKKRLEISSFYTSVVKTTIVCYTVAEIWCMTDVIVTFLFGLYFAFLPP